MAQTNRIPSGFLDLVGAETGGKNPNQYTDAVRSSVDMRELYLGQTLGSDTHTFVVASEGQTSGLMVVPQDEAWLLRSLSTQWTAADAATRFTVGVQLPDTPRGDAAFPMIWQSELQVVSAVGFIVFDAFYLPSPLLLLAGQVIQWRIGKFTGPGPTLRVQALFNRLRSGARP